MYSTDYLYPWKRPSRQRGVFSRIRTTYLQQDEAGVKHLPIHEIFACLFPDCRPMNIPNN